MFATCFFGTYVLVHSCLLGKRLRDEIDQIVVLISQEVGASFEGNKMYEKSSFTRKRKPAYCNYFEAIWYRILHSLEIMCVERERERERDTHTHTQTETEKERGRGYLK